MSNPINKENYEIIFFQLIEGGYNEAEENRLLEEIANDSFLAFEWENWKKAKLPNDDSAYFESNFTEFFNGIKNEAAVYNQDIKIEEKEDESKRRIIPLLFTVSSVAACFLIAFFVFTNWEKQSTESEVVLQGEPLTNIQDITITDNADTISQSVEIIQEDTPVELPAPDVPTNELEYVETKELVSIPSNPIEQEAPTPVFNLKAEDTLKTVIAQDLTIEDILKQVDTIIDTDAIFVKSAPKRKLKFTVEKSSLPPEIILTSVAQLSDLNIDMNALMQDQRVYVVRNADGLFLRLEKDGGEIYIALQ